MKLPELTPAEAMMVSEVEKRLADGERTITLTKKERLMIENALDWISAEQYGMSVKEFYAIKASIRQKIE